MKKTDALAFDPGRRAALRRGCAHCLLLGGLLTGHAARSQEATAPAASPSAAPAPTLPPRFTRPALDTDEGGLWALMDREETRLRRSPFLIRDKALDAYLASVVERLVGEHAADMRLYLLRTPLFNASMAPNGMMQVWSGLLLRMDNEAQLAAVLGHEIGHYLERHTLERLQDARSRAAFATFFALFGAVGAIGQLGVLAGSFGFSREQESRADRFSITLMRRAGYDPRQAAVVWTQLLDELRASGGGEAGRSSPMMATHPAPESRRDELLRLAGEGGGETGEPRWQELTAARRFDWMQDELRRGQPDESVALFARLLRAQPVDARLLYARGEALRLRAAPADIAPALVDLQACVALADAPTQAYRSLGLLLRQQQDSAGARQWFEKYLSSAPEAADAGLVRHALTELSP